MRKYLGATVASLTLLVGGAVQAAEYKDGPFPTSLDEVLELRSEMNGVDDCERQWDAHQKGEYCIMVGVNQTTKDIFIEAYLLLDKDDPRFANEEKIVRRFIDFEKWPAYAQASGENAIRNFNRSETMFIRDLPNGDKQTAHYYEYESKAPLIGYIAVQGTATYTLNAQPDPGALISAGFKMTETWGEPWQLITPMPDGGEVKGTRGHEANFHIVDISDENSFLVIYRTRVRLTTPILVELGAKYVTATVASLLKGIFIVD